MSKTMERNTTRKVTDLNEDGSSVCLICHNPPKDLRVEHDRDFVCPHCTMWLVAHPRNQNERFEDVVIQIMSKKYKGGKDVEDTKKVER